MGDAPTQRGEHSRAPGQPTVLVSVEPPLLATLLVRLLAIAGWAVTDASDGHEHAERVSAVVASQGAIIDFRDVASALTVILPDEQGRGGRVISVDGSESPLPAGGNGFAGLLDALGEVR